MRYDWKGLVKAYIRLSSHEALFQSLWITIGITLIVIFAVVRYDCNTYSLLGKVAELAVSIFPSLTGLAFAGYTIVIGTISPNILRRLSRRPSDKRFNSLLEDCNAIFTFMLVIAIVTLFLSFITLLMISCDWRSDSLTLVNFVNILSIFILSYCICVTFRSMLAVIINVFNFGQFLEFDSNRSNNPTQRNGKEIHS